MKKLISVIVFTLLFSCNVNDSSDESEISPLSASKFESIQINGLNVRAKIVFGTPTPCWYYDKTESSLNNGVFTAKVFGRTKGNICPQVIDSILVTENIIFNSSGKKELKFWRSDSTYLDTTITLN